MGIIKKKREGQELTLEEITFFFHSFNENKIPEYQMTALLMAIYLKGMSTEETFHLTEVMLHSGSKVNLKDHPLKKIDKHSTGGVGDKTSLLLGSIVAAAGVCVPMISGRGLGHTGGTLDKLESIPYFNTQLTLKQFEEQVKKHSLAFMGQTREICPCDRKVYALRDVTATVESMPLICASIMSKKLAEDIDGIVFDIKWGSGAFMKTEKEARELGHQLVDIAEKNQKKALALITNMNQPLGRFVGNHLEVQECLDILQNNLSKEDPKYRLYQDTKELSLHLAGHMLYLAEEVSSPEEGFKKSMDILDSGLAYDKFCQVCKEQGGLLDDFASISSDSVKSYKCKVLTAEKRGYIQAFHTENIGIASLLLGAGRFKSSDSIDPMAGIETHLKIGDEVKAGDPLFTLYSKNQKNLVKKASNLLQESVQIHPAPPKEKHPLLSSKIG